MGAAAVEDSMVKLDLLSGQYIYLEPALLLRPDEGSLFAFDIGWVRNALGLPLFIGTFCTD